MRLLMDLRRCGVLVLAALALGSACSDCSKQRSADGCADPTPDVKPVHVRDRGGLAWVVPGATHAPCRPRPDAQRRDASLRRGAGRRRGDLPPIEYEVVPSVHTASAPGAPGTGEDFEGEDFEGEDFEGEDFDVSADCAAGTYRIRYAARSARDSRAASTGTVTAAGGTVDRCDGRP